MNELLLLIVKAEHERAEVLSRAFRIGIAADDAISGLGDFDLLPILAAARFVEAARLLCDDAFESFLFRRSKQGEALTGEMV